jgi:hypothetical protein
LILRKLVLRPAGHNRLLPLSLLWNGLFVLMCGIFVLVVSGGANAQPPEQPIAIELNKLEAQEQGCRIYFVVGNKGDTEYPALKLDLVLFGRDGVIVRRFAVDLGPVRAERKSIKSFDLGETPCDQVGSFLINEALECRSDTEPVEDCLRQISVSSLSEVELSK